MVQLEAIEDYVEEFEEVVEVVNFIAGIITTGVQQGIGISGPVSDSLDITTQRNAEKKASNDGIGLYGGSNMGFRPSLFTLVDLSIAYRDTIDESSKVEELVWLE